MTVRGFFGEINRRAFEDDLGYLTQVVTRAIANGHMPAHWYVPVRDWCAANGHDCPEYLFKWSRKSPTKQNANEAPEIQGGTAA